MPVHACARSRGQHVRTCSVIPERSDTEKITPVQVEIETYEQPPASAVVPTPKQLAELVSVRLGSAAGRWQNTVQCDSIIGHPSVSAWLARTCFCQPTRLQATDLDLRCAVSSLDMRRPAVADRWRRQSRPDGPPIHALVGRIEPQRQRAFQGAGGQRRSRCSTHRLDSI